MRRALLLLVPLLLLAACTGSPDGPDDGAGGDTAPPAPAGPHWQPKPGLTWQWQLKGRLDPTVDAQVYDIDAVDQDAAAVADLHRRGRKVICYVSTGSWEDWRPDAQRFPKSVLGKGNGWSGERWLDIRRTDVLEPLVARRLDLCRQKGFDGVEPDNMDGYVNDTGFPLTAADQLTYNELVARLAHARGLAVGLKNDLDQIPRLLGQFDFAVDEQCAQYGECDKLTPFVKAGKAVFHAEYELTPDRFCARSRKLGLSSIQKKYDLMAWRRAC
ncbi:endo alpha-1,4 polygalactosaminidase [Streptomyces sp. NBC_00083]|uniref:endo alpha-1,4 polygalactosaminidase n=1 Tax=Streptomyces sp. NBC_00083 TaxID=2975647 RepID=UPI00224D0AA0|nr:endo alpha-1,4 polygalactosaminidase [Streptomyces sp. NBC_00083]MCX5382877.1 endo alpha-1,4 polygalactosaminidase [Streptomyces sp. NBC_00083]